MGSAVVYGTREDRTAKLVHYGRIAYQVPSVRRYSVQFMVVVALFITSLITANIIAVKLVSIGPFVVPAAAIVVFPLSYIFGDILTEVYGYREARRVIWLGFLCNLVVVVAIYVGQILPPAPVFDAQAAYERILGFTPRLLLASFVAYLVGEFANSIVLARLKIATGGRWLWMRTISSTLVGQALDSAIFISVAFVGSVPSDALLGLIVTQWLAKSAYEVVATPLTYLVVGYLKRKEGVDVFDRDTNLNPLLVSE
jgi:uncharacterized integral membrane protein (TIGR00697 family)